MIIISFIFIFNNPLERKTEVMTTTLGMNTTMVTTNTNYVGDTVSAEIQKNAQKLFNDSFVNANNIQKVRIIGTTDKGVGYDLYSKDLNVIKGWQNLFKKMEISVVPYVLVIGDHECTVSFFINGKEIKLGNIMGGLIYTDNQNYMYQINNSRDIYSELQTLKDKMGYQEN